MRVLFVCLIFLLSFAFAEDGVLERIYNPTDLLFLIDPATVTEFTNSFGSQEFERILQEELARFGYEIVPAITGRQAFVGQITDSNSEFIQERYAINREYNNFLFLGGSDDTRAAFTSEATTSSCGGTLVRVRVNGAEFNTDDPTSLLNALNDLQQVLTDLGIGTLGVGGEPAYCTKSSAKAPNFISATKANRVATVGNFSGQGSMIAILDTGISNVSFPLHPLRLDLVNLRDGTPFADDFVHPFSGVRGHGSIVASIANSIAPEADILPIRVCDHMGECFGADVLVGACYAVNLANDENKNLILNMSLAGANITTGNDIFEDTLRSITNFEQAPIAVAVGNEGKNPVFRDLYPAAYPIEGLLAVGGLEELSNPGHFWPTATSTKANWVEISAPSVNMLAGEPLSNSFSNPSGYSGTSFAAPIVAGALALMREASPSSSPAELEQCLLNSTQAPKPNPLNPLPTPTQVGTGMINIQAAINCITSP